MFPFRSAFAAEIAFAPKPPLAVGIVDGSPGMQRDAHIDGTLVAHTDYGRRADIRWIDLATGVSGSVPNPDGHYDFLSNVSGSWVVLTRIASDRQGIFAYNVSSGELRELAPAAGVERFAPAIGGSTVAWQEVAASNGIEIVVHDLETGSTVQLTDDRTLLNVNASV